MDIPFTKMHGLGNDYLFIDAARHPIDDPAELSRRMSERHLGAGSDGIILVLPGREGDFAMRIFNADGRRGGNLRQRDSLLREIRV